MSRVIVAEYDANENALRPAEPLPGVKDPLARLASLDGPTGDIDQTLSEIEAGRR